MKAGELLVARYETIAHLGTGGFGEVWSVLDRVEGVKRAVKLLVGPALKREDARARFLAEARIANAFVHPNLVEVLDVFQLGDGTLGLVMELLEGQTLGSRLADREPMALREVAALLGPIVGATAAVHAHGIVHRDIKPDNIFLARTPWGLVMPKLLDFGIAKMMQREGAPGPVTSTGATLGTPCYMAPEQAFGEADTDARADVFALGVVLYECLAGCRPIEAANLGQYVKQLSSSAVLPLAELRPDLPKRLLDLVAAMLATDRARRPSLDGLLACLATFDPPPGVIQPANVVAQSVPVAPRAELVAQRTAIQSHPAAKVAAPKQQVAQPSEHATLRPRRWAIGAALGLLVAVLTALVTVALDPVALLLRPQP